MKRILSAFLVISVLSSMICVSSIAVGANTDTYQNSSVPAMSDAPFGDSGNTSIYLKIVSVTEGESIVCDLCVNDVNELGIASGGFYVNYPEMLTLESCVRVYPNGFFITSQELDSNPYQILWVLGTNVLPFEEVTVARLTFGFKYVPDMDDEIRLDLSCDPDNAPATIEGDIIEEEIEVTPEISHTYGELVNSPEFGDGTALELECVRQAASELVLELYLDCGDELDISAFNVEMSYPQGFTLVSCEQIFDTGIIQFGDVTNNAHTTVAALGTSAYPHGRTCLARYVFNIDDDVSKDDSSEIKLSVAEAVTLDGKDVTNRIWESGYSFDPSVSVKSIVLTKLPENVKYITENCSFEFTGGSIQANYWDGNEVSEIALSDCTLSDYTRDGKDVYIVVEYKGCTAGFAVENVFLPGDVNVDGKISLNDVNLVLKYIAKWDVNVDPRIADVSADGKVTLADVNLILKYIAKWDVTLI